MQKYTITFNEWLRGKAGKNYLIISGILAFLYSVIPIAQALHFDIVVHLPKVNITKNQIDVLPYIIQTVFISFVVLFAAFKFVTLDKPNITSEKEIKIWSSLRLHKPGTESPGTDEEKKELWIKYKKMTTRTARQFANFWFSCWIVWLAFYILFTVNKFEKILSLSVLNLANNITGLFFVFLFMTLSSTTKKYNFWQWSRFSLVIIGVFLLEVSQNGNKSSGYIFSLFSGVFVGLAMAAFIGSINSRTITIPLWVLLLLNLYSAIQPLYVFFVNDGMIMADYSEIVNLSGTVILLVAFFLKILLFLLVTWVLQTGRLMHFIIQEGSLDYEKEDKLKILVENIKLKETRVTEYNEEEE